MDFLHIPKQEGLQNLTAGNLLIAEPFLADPGFSRSVVLLCEHGENGSVGYMINKSTEWVLSDLFPEFAYPSISVGDGGPVQHDTLHMIHRMPELGGIQIAPGIFWGGNYDELQGLMTDKGYDPSDIRLLLGYSGWSAGQLDKEMSEGSWLVCELNDTLIFDTDNGEIWKEAIRSLGKDFQHLVNMPTNPQLN